VENRRSRRVSGARSSTRPRRRRRTPGRASGRGPSRPSSPASSSGSSPSHIRTFSRRSTSPGSRSSIAESASSPQVSETNATGWSRWSAKISACSSSETNVSSPGRPWWASTAMAWSSASSSRIVSAWRAKRRLSCTVPSSTAALTSIRTRSRWPGSRSSIGRNVVMSGVWCSRVSFPSVDDGPSGVNAP